MLFPADVVVMPQPWLWVPRVRPIRLLEIHATRGGGSPDIQFQATVNWMRSPNNRAQDRHGNLLDWGSSCSYIIGRDGQLGVVLADDQAPTFSAGYGDKGSEWSIDEYGISYEWCQSANQEEFTTEQYERGGIEYATKCRIYGIPARMPDIRRQSGEAPAGLVRHDRSENGRKLGKTDPGERFREFDFLALVREKIRSAEEGDEDVVLIIAAESNPVTKFVLYPGLGKRPLRYEELKAVVGGIHVAGGDRDRSPHLSRILSVEDFDRIPYWNHQTMG